MMQKHDYYDDRKFRKYFDSLSEQEKANLDDSIKSVVEKIIIEWKKEKEKSAI